MQRGFGDFVSFSRLAFERQAVQDEFRHARLLAVIVGDHQLAACRHFEVPEREIVAVPSRPGDDPAQGPLVGGGVNDAHSQGAFLKIDVDVQAILDVARDAAHSVVRPAAPVATFLVGYAAGKRAAAGDDIAAECETASELAKNWVTP